MEPLYSQEKFVIKGSHISILIVLFLLGVMKAYSQEQHYSYISDQVEIREVLDALEDQSGLIFAYNNRLFDDSKQVSVSIQEKTLEEALEVLFVNQGLRFIRVEQQIVIKKERRGKMNLVEEEEVASVFELRYTVSGYVRDVGSGEVLIGATVRTADGKYGAISNNYGFFSLTMNRLYDSLHCSYIGFRSMVLGVGGQTEQKDFHLQEEKRELAEVVVYSDEVHASLRTVRSSEQKVRVESVQKMPALFGEKDVIKSLAAVPGIKFFGDGSTIFYVRGGARDQNLVQIDEAPVYNPAHLMGFFSTVVPDAVKDIKVYKGDFPSKYGGRLSSLIDIHTKDGNMQQFGMDASVGLLSSKLSLEGPIVKDRMSFFMSARRSHILGAIQRMNDDVRDLRFSDFHGKLNYVMNEKNRFFFSVYNSLDNFESREGISSVSGIKWQNTTGTFRWNHIFNERMFSNTTVYASNYDYFLNTNLSSGDYWNSHIDNFTLKSDFTWYISAGNTLRYGWKISQHFMNPGNFYQNHRLVSFSYPISTKSANELALYVSDQILVSDHLSLRLGLRLNSWTNVGEAYEYAIEEMVVLSRHYGLGEVYNNYLRADPRIALAYKNGGGALWKMSVSSNSQFEHLITNSISPFSTLEVWLPSGPMIQPQRATQLTLGYSGNTTEKGLKLEVEGYYKRMKHQIDYKDHANLILNPFVEYELRFGEGRAYGMEWMLSKKQGRLSGWLSYTLSRSVYEIGGINSGNPYPSYGDRPHDLSAFLAWQVNKRLSLTGNFVYMTGAPITTPTAFYYVDNIQVPVYFKRNNDRLPDYHRMDVALNWNLRKKEDVKFKQELIFSVYNVYGKKNPIALHFNKVVNAQGQLLTPYNFYEKPDLVPSMFYIYRMVPSLSYRFSF